MRNVIFCSSVALVLTLCGAACSRTTPTSPSPITQPVTHAPSGPAPSGPLPIVEGTYTLRVVAAAECRDRLPGSAQARTYTAVITQTDAQLTVVLKGANLESAYGPSDTFFGSVEPDRVLFSLSRYSGNWPPTFAPPSVAELLAAPNTYVTFFGSVVTVANGNGYSGALNGNIEVLNLAGPWDYGDAYTRLAYCESTGHQFILTR